MVSSIPDYIATMLSSIRFGVIILQKFVGFKSVIRNRKKKLGILKNAHL